VARLVGQGYTDRQIAAELVISVGTAGVHVHHILEKLGLRSRWQVADWARRQEAAESSAD
jgi:DNA-binding NarL/FixJ family response regulator